VELRSKRGTTKGEGKEGGRKEAEEGKVCVIGLAKIDAPACVC